jgi:hypothetical protein
MPQHVGVRIRRPGRGSSQHGPSTSLRRCRSELHTTQGRKRKVMMFEPSRAFDTPLTTQAEIP